MLLDMKETLTTDNFLSMCGDGNVQVSTRQTCSSCHKVQLSPGIRGQTVECPHCTTKTITNFVHSQSKTSAGLGCSWCLRSHCAQAHEPHGCSPQCECCLGSFLHHRPGCHLGPPSNLPSLRDIEHLLREGEKPPKLRPLGQCNCQYRASSSEKQESQGLASEGGEEFHWLDCPRRQERIYVNEVGPALLIEPDEPRDYIEGLRVDC